MIHDAINKDVFTLSFPKDTLSRILYICQIPLTHLQLYSIPNPMKKGK